MEKLDGGKIDVQTAKAQSELAKQANNVLKYELDRANVQMKLEMHRRQTGSDIRLREVEGKVLND